MKYFVKSLYITTFLGLNKVNFIVELRFQDNHEFLH